MKAVLIAFSLLLTSVSYAEHGHGGYGGGGHYHGGGYHGGAYYGGGHHGGGYYSGGYYGGGYYNNGFGISINLAPGYDYGYVANDGLYYNSDLPDYAYDRFGNPAWVSPDY